MISIIEKMRIANMSFTLQKRYEIDWITPSRSHKVFLTQKTQTQKSTFPRSEHVPWEL